MTTQEIQQLLQIHKTKFKKYFESGFYLSDNSLQDFEKYQLNAMCLLSLEQPKQLAVLLKCRIYELEEMLNQPNYEGFSITKKRGGSRQIFAPEKPLKLVQKRLNYFLQAYYLWIKPTEVHGFTINLNKKEPYCNIVENAKLHVNKKYVLNLDLLNFFPSINAYRVKALFQSDYFRYNEQVATALALLVTYEGTLPIGAPTSPVISNFICLPLDAMLAAYCIGKNIQYSRYADDLTFSSNFEITKSHLDDLSVIINTHHFTINPKKTRLNLNHRKQTATGIIINKKVNVDRKIIKMVRAMLYDALQNGVSKATIKHFRLKNEMNKTSNTYFLNRLDGYINFIAQVRGKEDTLVLKFKEQFKMIHLPNY